MTETSDRREQRLAKLEMLRQAGIEPYPPRSNKTHTAQQALAAFAAAEDGNEVSVTVAGRLVSVRVMGGSTFAHLSDGSGQIQFYLRRDVLGEVKYDLFRHGVDLGDFVEIPGVLFKTRTGEVTVRASDWVLLSKTLRDMPEKWHGLRDTETRYRQRYLDLIANEKAREIFLARTQIVSAVRRVLDGRGFLEVETPVLQPIYGGAAARPFTTHHNALDQTLYLRIADELYLKRLIIGGFDRVYEIGHNFRNEGISTNHNPEFTACEVYQAYGDWHTMMNLVEELYGTVATELTGSMVVPYQGQEIDYSPPWRRVSMRDAILEHGGIDIRQAPDYEALTDAIASKGIAVARQPSWGHLVEKLFGVVAEPHLVQPTFLIDFPTEVSPLAKKKPAEDDVVERFEFYIAGLECGNAFTELNDPLDQRERFEEQRRAAQEKGDAEAHPMDEDFILALEHGMPPTGGLGFGIDRMVMLFTDQSSIREVILFPHLRTT